MSESFAEAWVGVPPKRVYGVKVRGKGQDGKQHTYIFLFASKVNFDRAVEQFPKGLIAEGDVVTTLAGTVEWEETGTLVPAEKVVKLKPPKKAKGRAA